MICLILLWVQLAHAELRWEEVRTRVKTDFPSLLEALDKVAAAEAGLQSAQGAFDTKVKGQALGQQDEPSYNRFWEFKLEQRLPSLGQTLYAGRRQGNGTYATVNGKSATTAVGEVFAGIELPLLRDLQMDEARLNRINAQTELATAGPARRQKELEVLLKSGQAYWKWVAAAKKLQIVRDWLVMAEKRQSWLERRLAAGDLERIKVDEGQRSIAKRRSEEQKALREFEAARAYLGIFFPDHPLEVAAAPLHFPAMSEDPQTTAFSIEDVPALRIFEVQLEQLQQERRWAHSQALPDLRVGLEAARDLGGIGPGRTDPDQLRLGIRLEVPLENNKAEGKQAEVTRKLRMLEHRRALFRREWEAQVSQGRVNVQTLREQVGWQKEEVEKSDILAKAEEKKFRLGSGDLFLVNLREQDAAEARVRLVESQAGEGIAQLELDFLRARLD